MQNYKFESEVKKHCWLGKSIKEAKVHIGLRYVPSKKKKKKKKNKKKKKKKKKKKR